MFAQWSNWSLVAMAKVFEQCLHAYFQIYLFDYNTLAAVSEMKKVYFINYTKEYNSSLNENNNVETIILKM